MGMLIVLFTIVACFVSSWLFIVWEKSYMRGQNECNGYCYGSHEINKNGKSYRIYIVKQTTCRKYINARQYDLK